LSDCSFSSNCSWLFSINHYWGKIRSSGTAFTLNYIAGICFLSEE